MKRKYISVKEFREFGYLQEINRRVLHPLGLALSVDVKGNGEEVFAGIWDFREDKEGLCFADGMVDIEKKERIESELNEKYKERQKTLGYKIQEK